MPSLHHSTSLTSSRKTLASRSSVLTGKIACVVKEANEVADLCPSMKLSWTVHASGIVRFWYPSKIFISTSWGRAAGSCCSLVHQVIELRVSYSSASLTCTCHPNPIEKVHKVGKRHLWWWCALSWWLVLEKLSVIQVQDVTVRYGKLIPLTQCLVIPWYILWYPFGHWSPINSSTSVQIKNSPEVTKTEAITQSACGLIICHSWPFCWM